MDKRQRIVSLLRAEYQRASESYRRAHAEHMGQVAAANTWDRINARIYYEQMREAYDFAVDTFVSNPPPPSAPTGEPMTQPEKHRASYLTVSQAYNLNVVCRPLASIGYGTFHVGSSLEKPDYHDVDLRCMLPDDEYDRMFDSDQGDGLLFFLNTAISEWIANRTGLPIDFQFQRATEANAAFTGRRNAVGH